MPLELMLAAAATVPYQYSMEASFLQIVPLLGLAFFTSAGVTALLYMVGNALQSQDIIAMGKDNLGNLVFSAIIVLLFMALFVLFSELANSIACGGAAAGCDHIQAAYMSVMQLRAKLFSLYSQLYVYEILFGFLSTLGFSIPFPAFNPATMLGLLISIPSLSFSPLSGLTPISNAHTVIVEAVGTAVLAVLARQVILEFIMHYMFPFFVLGAGLRAFSFTRKTGSSILALSAVAFFVYPLAVMFTNYMIFQAYQPTNFGVVPTAVGYCSSPQTTNDLATRFSQERSTLYNPGLTKASSPWYMFWQFFYSAVDFVSQSLKMMINALYAFNGSSIFGLALTPVAFSTFFDFIIMEIQSLVQFLVLVFVSFFIEIIITITMYRGIAMFMEGETEIFGISKLM
ncbi:Uncharacterised protein [uncultured archaeon]|nr:Uncharacterised protein [uncultured archaeon]